MMARPENYGDFKISLQSSQPPYDWPEALKSLWHDAKGDWKASHDIAQDMHNDLGSWIHAYLHRKEGDASNAGYWYRRAKKEFPEISLEEEHREITEYVLRG
ncbi:MAG TPA: hypothetical protein VFM69_03275 [Pricia sp.]|nr:hypothetical protein [Pricia sp.]